MVKDNKSIKRRFKRKLIKNEKKNAIDLINIQNELIKINPEQAKHIIYPVKNAYKNPNPVFMSPLEILSMHNKTNNFF
jgi:hypothetical protein